MSRDVYKNFFTIVISLFLGLLSVWLLSKNNDGIQFNLIFTLFNFDVILIVILLKMIAMMLISYRWVKILQYNNLYQSFLDSFKFVLVGHSLSIIIPGIVSQDIVKVAGTIHTSKSSGNKMAIVSLAILDRLFGLISLFIVTIIFTTIYISLESINLYSNLLDKLMVSALFFSIFCISILIVTYFVLKKIQKIQFSSKKISNFYSKMLKIIDHFHEIRNKEKLLCISMFSHIVNSIILVVIVKEFYSEIEIIVNVIFCLISNLGNLFPFTPSGLGVTESIFVYLYSLIGYENGVTIGVSFRLLSYTSFLVLTTAVVLTSYLWKYKQKK
ncbi:flippase-like domain-containing protein [Methylophilaceae bacterium]|nr:flippase-like domain-containing protein [Methylophilaceae bacterium]